MNRKEHRAVLSAALLALLCCVAAFGAVRMITTGYGWQNAGAVLLVLVLPIAVIALSAGYAWNTGRFPWTVTAVLTAGCLLAAWLGFGSFAPVCLAGMLAGVLAAAVGGFCLLARREMPRTGSWAYFVLAAVHLVACLFDGLLSTGMLAGILAADVVCCLAITLLVFRAGRRATFYPAVWTLLLFAPQLGMVGGTLPFHLARTALHLAVILIPQLLLTLALRRRMTLERAS